MKKYLDPKADLTFKKIFGELEELLDNPETSKALETVEEAAMTKSELLAYDDFWDKVGVSASSLSTPTRSVARRALPKGVPWDSRKDVKKDVRRGVRRAARKRGRRWSV